MKTPILHERLDFLIERRERIDAEIQELRTLLNLDAGQRRRPHVVPECGDESAYQRHRYYGDTAEGARRVTCDPCLAAHAAHERRKKAARRELEAAS